MYFSGTPLEKTCDQFVPCPPSPSRYQTQDGRCNHPDPAKATWGAAGSPMERLLPPSYQDGVWEPRSLSVDGTPLTNPRTISRFLLSDADRPHPVINLLFMQFGQFMSHDVTQSASITTSKYHFFSVDSIFIIFVIEYMALYLYSKCNRFVYSLLGDGRSVTCCTEDGSRVLPPEFLHYSCLPITVEPQDEFYSQFNQGCINFVRSALAPDDQCRVGYGKQVRGTLFS